MSPITRRSRRATAAIAATGALALVLTACSSGSGGGSSDDAESALDEGGTITVWAWDPTLESVAADFEEENPGVTVELVNAGTGNDQYTALQNAIAAGSGVPDIAQIEYYALPQFALSEALTDLTSYGADELDETFTPGPWNAVTQGDGVFALPTDSGPMALFYNKRVFDEHGIAVPTTWDEYVEAGRALRAADPNAYITNDTGDAGFTTSLIWQAGGRPYQVDGTDVTIDFTDEGTQQFASTWQTMIDEELVAPVTSWSDEWYQGLADGSIASLVIGAWMRGNLETSVESASGDWAVAPMPQWEAGAGVTSENGGSSLAIPAASENQDLAWAFLEYATVGDGIATRVAEGAFPATVAELEADDFTQQEFEYFGGQKVNEVLAESATQVAEGWEYLPFQVYANSIFNDTVGQSYVSDTPLTEGLQAWQDASVTYGSDQGFTVNE